MATLSAADLSGSALNAFEADVVLQPERLAGPDEEVALVAKQALKHLYGCSKATEPEEMAEMDELLVDGFDEEQVWEQLQLQFRPLLKFLKLRTNRLLAQSDLASLGDGGKRGQRRRRSKASNKSGGSGGAGRGNSSQSRAGEDAESAGGSGSEDSEGESSAAEESASEEAAEDSSVQSSGDGEGGADGKDAAEEEGGVAMDASGAMVTEDPFFSLADMDKFAEMEDAAYERERRLADGEDTDEDSEGEEGEGEADVKLMMASDEEEEDEGAAEAAAAARAADLFLDPGVRVSESDAAPKRRKHRFTRDGLLAGDGAESEDEEDSEEEEEGEEEASEEEGEGVDSDEGGRRKPKRVHDLFAEDDDGEEEQKLSKYQKAQRRLRARAEEAEKELVADKKWTLTGETTARKRPDNSLLETYLEFDTATKVAPEVTVETTATLEEMIRQRILDGAWDDVEGRDAASALPILSENKAPHLPQERSKKGLGELYEDDFLKEAMGYEAEPEARKKEKELTALFRRITHKLDALTNYHFTPKPHIPEMSVKATAPAIAMEEVLPVTTAADETVAPEEVAAKGRGRGQLLRGDTEANPEEKQAERRAKKTARRKAKRQRDSDMQRAAKLNPALGNKYAKQKALEAMRLARNVSEGKAMEDGPGMFTKSAQFFSKLQKESEGREAGKPRKKKARSGIKGAAFKM